MPALTGRDSKKIICKLLKTFKEFLEQKNIVLKEGTVLSMISKAKAKCHTPIEFLKQLRKKSDEAKKIKTVAPPTDVDFLVAKIYETYEEYLRRNNSLDFDDLLLYGVKLFAQNKRTVSWCKHVLVDELWV